LIAAPVALAVVAASGVLAAAERPTAERPIDGGLAPATATLRGARVAPRTLAQQAGATVALSVPPESHGRLAEELRRELEASQFSVLSLPARAAGAEDERTFAARLLGSSSALVAVVEADAGRIRIFSRAAAPQEPPLLTELTAQEDDRPARRRVCLAVVEQLRRITPAPAPPPVAPARPPAPVPDAVPPPEAGTRRPLWWFGATSDLNVLSARGTPTAHISLIAERPLTERLTVAARAAWPILGAQFTDQERFIRTWTFAAETGVNLRLVDRGAALRPVLGAAIGLRSALTDTDEFEMRTSRIVMTPALSFAINAGLRYRLRPLVDLLFVTDLSQAVIVWPDRRDYEAAAARERLLRLSLGVLFEY
jgi:hypothetical protein